MSTLTMPAQVETDSDRAYRALKNTQRRNEQEQEGHKLRLIELQRQHKLNAAMIAAYESEKQHA